jgi:5'(3')-deoxyribonucleotidase/uncharacterized protein with PQ loop repeat
MSGSSASAIVGSVAAMCTTLSFVPQLVKVRQQGGRDLSWGMLLVFLAGGTLWLTYGVLVRDVPVIVANAVTGALVVAIVSMKFAAERGPGGVSDFGGRRLRVAIDMDEVIADALSEHLRRYNDRFGTSLEAMRLQGHLEDCVPAAHVGATHAMIDASFFEDLPVMPGAQEVVRQLTEHYEVIVATAAMDVPCSFDAKFRWLQRHFPFIPPSQFVFCGDKGVVHADYLIDDRSRHFARFMGQPILFSAPHNGDEHRYPRVANWDEVRRLLLGAPDDRPEHALFAKPPVGDVGVRPTARGVQ